MRVTVGVSMGVFKESQGVEGKVLLERLDFYPVRSKK